MALALSSAAGPCILWDAGLRSYGDHPGSTSAGGAPRRMSSLGHRSLGSAEYRGYSAATSPGRTTFRVSARHNGDTVSGCLELHYADTYADTYQGTSRPRALDRSHEPIAAGAGLGVMNR